MMTIEKMLCRDREGCSSRVERACRSVAWCVESDPKCCVLSREVRKQVAAAREEWEEVEEAVRGRREELRALEEEAERAERR
eukprot:2756657-Rhodomonas_salina.1